MDASRIENPPATVGADYQAEIVEQSVDPHRYLAVAGALFTGVMAFVVCLLPLIDLHTGTGINFVGLGTPRSLVATDPGDALTELPYGFVAILAASSSRHWPSSASRKG